MKFTLPLAVRASFSPRYPLLRFVNIASLIPPPRACKSRRGMARASLVAARTALLVGTDCVATAGNCLTAFGVATERNYIFMLLVYDLIIFPASSEGFCSSCFIVFRLHHTTLWLFV
jgi:hypothetical protein